jgi:hypothetical protein
MDRTEKTAKQLVEQVRPFFPTLVRRYLSARCESRGNGTPTMICIHGRFPDRLPEFHPKLLEAIQGQVTESNDGCVVIEGKWQGLVCRIELRCETLAAVAQ